MRHGAVDRDSSPIEARQRLSATGIRETYLIAKVLQGYLELLPFNERIEIGEVLYSPYRHANETAGAVVDVFSKCAKKLRHCEYVGLSPVQFSLSSPEKADQLARELSARLQTIGADVPEANALLIVGHAPQLGWIANYLIGASRWRSLPPPARSEVHCLRFKSVKKPARHIWSISPSDRETMAALKEKIMSKMTTAAQLGSVITFLLGVSLNLLADRDKLDKLIP